jgi:hypothetical protein
LAFSLGLLSLCDDHVPDADDAVAGRADAPATADASDAAAEDWQRA